MKFNRFKQFAVIGLGALGGYGVYYYSVQSPKKVHASWTTNYDPSAYAKWDSNWDHRCPESIVKPIKNASPEEENKYNERLEKCKPTGTRHLLLIRHGQYNLEGKTDKERFLTEKGCKQAHYTGLRLKELNLPYTLLVRSTMTRAQETGSIIHKLLPNVPVEDSSLLEEGAPIPPEPPVGHWKPEPYQFYQDGARIEAAYRRYFHREDPEHKTNTYTVLVCHANVIRYFVCRALQFPPEAWLRISLNHASITWISINPNGRVVLRQLGESGHMPVEYVSRR